MLENIGGAEVRFSHAELTEFSASVSAIQVQGARLPEFVQVFSEVEAQLALLINTFRARSVEALDTIVLYTLSAVGK